MKIMLIMLFGACLVVGLLVLLRWLTNSAPTVVYDDEEDDVVDNVSMMMRATTGQSVYPTRVYGAIIIEDNGDVAFAPNLLQPQTYPDPAPYQDNSSAPDVPTYCPSADNSYTAPDTCPAPDYSAPSDYSLPSDTSSDTNFGC